MSDIQYYLDENVDPEIAAQLKQHGISAVSVRDLGLAGDSDLNHLQRATAMNCVLCTHDADFLRIHAQNDNHTGIAFGQHFDSTIGGWVRELVKLSQQKSGEEMRGQVVFLSVK